MKNENCNFYERFKNFESFVSSEYIEGQSKTVQEQYIEACNELNIELEEAYNAIDNLHQAKEPEYAKQNYCFGKVYFITIDLLPGTHIDWACDAAINLYYRYSVNVRFNFNGIKIECNNVNNTSKKLSDIYYEEIKKTNQIMDEEEVIQNKNNARLL